MSSKAERVKALFEVPEKYLNPFQAEIRLRMDAVQYFIGNSEFEHALDVGCGDGSISLQLLPHCRRMTLVDLSAAMLDLARRRVSFGRAPDVEFIRADLNQAPLPDQTFDLIVCLGVLAHVDSPAAVIARLSRLAKPGALIALEFTDSFHFWSFPFVLYNSALKLFRPHSYQLNLLKQKQIRTWCADSGLKGIGLYRYARPPIGASALLDHEQTYRLTRRIFGPPDQNRNRWIGNEFIYLLQKAPST